MRGLGRGVEGLKIRCVFGPGVLFRPYHSLRSIVAVCETAMQRKLLTRKVSTRVEHILGGQSSIADPEVLPDYAL